MIDYSNKIAIVPGTTFKNRTSMYLAPALRLYGEEFLTKIRSLSILALGIQDYGFNKTDRDIKNEIYILVDTNGKKKYDQYADQQESKVNFTFCLNWLQQQPYYSKDYPYDSGRHGYMHMIVLRLSIPTLMDNFIKGNYSELYTTDIIEKYVSKVINDQPNEVYGILTKNDNFYEYYCAKLNETFGSNLKVSDIRHHDQLDVPPMFRNEIFRFDHENSFKFISNSLNNSAI